MICSEYEISISRLLDNELAEDLQAQTFTHLASCLSCREFFQTSRFVRRHLEDVPAYPPRLDDSIEGFALPKIITFTAQRRKTFFSRRIPVPFPAAAAVILALALSLAFTFNAYEHARETEETVIYVPTLPEVQVEATPFTRMEERIP